MKTKLAIYVLIPLGVSLALNAMYFSQSIVLQRIVVPKLPPLTIDSWREYGLLENLQNIVLLYIVAVSIIGLVRAREKFLKAGFAVFCLGTVFIFLEEIDYGMHFYRYMTLEDEIHWFTPAGEWPPDLISKMDLSVEPFNIHNKGDLIDIFKLASLLMLLGGFLVLPLVADRIKHPLITYLAPEKWAIALLVVMLAMSNITHAWADIVNARIDSGLHQGEVGAINKNLSEFRELLIYYLLAVHISVVVFYRKYSKPETPGTQGAAESA